MKHFPQGDFHCNLQWENHHSMQLTLLHEKLHALTLKFPSNESQSKAFCMFPNKVCDSLEHPLSHPLLKEPSKLHLNYEVKFLVILFAQELSYTDQEHVLCFWGERILFHCYL